MAVRIKFLGIAQDAGIPQIGCNCKVCSEIYRGERKEEYPVSLGIINEKTGKKFMIEATPEFSKQYRKLIDIEKGEKLGGIILTHAHIGHYTGLMMLGREALNTKKLKVFVSSKMGEFLKNNAPWNQLIKLDNIEIIEFKNRVPFVLDEGIEITPIEVTHRNEYADTYGFLVKGEEKIFFVPDIDRWSGFEDDLNNLIKECKKVIVDATFYTKEEIGKVRGRDLNEIPHPTIEETIKYVEDNKLPSEKIVFTHFNHTNMVLSNEAIRKSVEEKGFILSQEDMEILI